MLFSTNFYSISEANDTVSENANLNNRKRIEAVVEYDSEVDDGNFRDREHEDDHEHGPSCGCSHGNDHDDIINILKDPYHDVIEHEDVIEEEIIPLGWYEHLKLPSIKSSIQLKAFTEDMIMRPANHIFLYYYTSDCYNCY